MKSVYILFFCFASLLLNAQVPMFQKTWYSSGADFASAVLTADSGYVLLMTTNANTPNSKAQLIKTDKYGDSIWTKTLYYPNIQVGAGGITYTNDNCILFSIDSANYMRTYKMNLSGNILWIKNGGYFNIKNCYDNGFILPSGNANAKLDSLFNLQFFYGYTPLNDQFPSTAIQTTDSGFAICGITRTLASGGFSDRDIFVARTDRNGVLIWSKAYGHPSGIDYGNDIVQTPDGGFLICGRTIGIGAGNADMIVVKTDASGNQQWCKTYGDTAFDDAIFIRKVVGSTDYYIVGHTEGMENTFFLGTKTILMRIDMFGNFVSGRIFRDPNTPNLAEMAINSCYATPDGGIMLAGYKYTYMNNADAFIIKTNSSCSSGCNEMVYSPTIYSHTLITNTGMTSIPLTSPISPANSHDITHEYLNETIICTNHIITSTNETPNTTNEFLIYPNPATTQVTLQPQQPFKNAVVTIYNTLGAMVMQYQNIKAEKITTETNELPAGIYFITVLDEDKTYTSKLIIE